MAKMKKEQQQIVMLVAVLGIIAVVLIFFYREKFLPRPTGEAVLLAPPPRLQIPPGGGDALYERDDFKALKRFGDVPVRPLETGGSPEPFVSESDATK